MQDIEGGMGQSKAGVCCSGQLAGKHRLFGRATTEWTAAYSRTRRLEPGTMPLQYQGPQGLVSAQEENFTAFTLPDSLVLSAAISRKGDLPTRNHFDQYDNTYLGKQPSAKATCLLA